MNMKSMHVWLATKVTKPGQVANPRCGGLKISWASVRAKIPGALLWALSQTRRSRSPKGSSRTLSGAVGCSARPATSSRRTWPLPSEAQKSPGVRLVRAAVVVTSCLRRCFSGKRSSVKRFFADHISWTQLPGHWPATCAVFSRDEYPILPDNFSQKLIGLIGCMMVPCRIQTWELQIWTSRLLRMAALGPGSESPEVTFHALTESTSKKHTPSRKESQS